MTPDILAGADLSLLIINLFRAFIYALADATRVSVCAPSPTTVLPSSANLTETSACASVPSVTAWT